MTSSGCGRGVRLRTAADKADPSGSDVPPTA